eukprot:Amastigsp_a676195_31.p2 type:complete len:264 gc:universal Amastigsp_a676195_31:380-1171(+)
MEEQMRTEHNLAAKVPLLDCSAPVSGHRADAVERARNLADDGAHRVGIAAHVGALEQRGIKARRRVNTMQGHGETVHRIRAHVARRARGSREAVAVVVCTPRPDPIFEAQMSVLRMRFLRRGCGETPYTVARRLERRCGGLERGASVGRRRRGPDRLDEHMRQESTALGGFNALVRGERLRGRRDERVFGRAPVENRDGGVAHERAIARRRLVACERELGELLTELGERRCDVRAKTDRASRPWFGAERVVVPVLPPREEPRS